MLSFFTRVIISCGSHPSIFFRFDAHIAQEAIRHDARIEFDQTILIADAGQIHAIHLTEYNIQNDGANIACAIQAIRHRVCTAGRYNSKRFLQDFWYLVQIGKVRPACQQNGEQERNSNWNNLWDQFVCWVNAPKSLKLRKMMPLNSSENVPSPPMHTMPSKCSSDCVIMKSRIWLDRCDITTLASMPAIWRIGLTVPS